MSIGVDVGGTKCLGVLWSEGRIIAETRRATPVGDPEGPEGLMATIASVVNELDTSAPARVPSSPVSSIPVGLGMPGLVSRRGVVRSSPHLAEVADLAVRDRLEERLDRRVWVDNDATCAAVAEWRAGAGIGTDDLVTVTLGTGIGGGIISSGAVMRGAHGFAGEIGHMVIDPQGPPCPCGQRGCWERFASGSALQSRADDVFGKETTRAEDLGTMADAGDPRAREIFADFARWVALGLANITNMFDPALIVLGGGVVRNAPLFLSPVRHHFAEMLYASHLREHPPIVVAAWDERAGAVGAALLPGLSDHSNSR